MTFPALPPSLCEGARRSLTSTAAQARITKCLGLQPAASAYPETAAGRRAVREHALVRAIFKDGQQRGYPRVGESDPRPFLRGWTINTRIIRVPFNDRHFFVELRLPRTKRRTKKRGAFLPMKSTCTATTRQTQARSDTYELTASYILKNISVDVRLHSRDYRRL